MISDQGAREAAERLIGKDRPHEDYRSQQDHDEYTIAVFVRHELARREAERAERAEPITAEWCLANGAVYSREKRRYQFPGGARQVIWSTGVGVGLYFGALGMAFTPEVTTCGGLSDLLAALRGTERPA